MSTLKANKISGNLEKKGFKKETKHDHYKFYFYIDGKKTSINTKISLGENEIGEPLIKKMSDQMKLNKLQFIDFVSCTISKEEYTCILKEKGFL